MMCYRFLTYFLGSILFLIFSNSTVLQTFANQVDLDSVTVSPVGAITPLDDVTLEAFLTSGSCCIANTQPTTTQLIGNNFVVDIFAESGFLTIPDQKLESVSLGMLSPGAYTYDVNLTTFLFPLPSSFQSISGSFVVVPEPSAFSLMCGLFACGLMRKRNLLRACQKGS